MDKPFTIGMFVRVCGIGLVPFILFLWGLSNAKTEHAVKIQKIESTQEEMKLEVNGKLDKMDNKLDRIMYKQEYQSK